MNKVLRNLALASLILAAPAALLAQGGGGGQGGGQRGGGGGFGGGGFGGRGGRGGGFVPNGPAGPLAGRADIYNSTNGESASVGKPTAKGEHYYLVGSVDQSPQQQQILLKKPNEITLLLKVTPDTKFTSENGKPLKISDFRAGDTVWVTYKGTGTDASAATVRAGGMSVADLHRYFLNYPEIK